MARHLVASLVRMQLVKGKRDYVIYLVRVEVPSPSILNLI